MANVRRSSSLQNLHPALTRTNGFNNVESLQLPCLPPQMRFVMESRIDSDIRLSHYVAE
jgi:hypothetical protein